jgi:dissimilatory sulfite reductase related protein
MPTETLAGHTVELDSDGFMTDSAAWNKEIAVELAKRSGIELNDRHWAVIEFCRSDAQAKGEAPGVRRITKNTDVSMREMYKLFPKGPGKLAALVSGLAKPKGCI